MPGNDPARQLTDVAEELATARTEDAAGAAAVAHALRYVSDADRVSVTLRSRRHRYVTLAASDELSRTLDERQYQLSEGPCVDAAVGFEWFRSGDVGADSRWTRWGPAARSLGVNSIISVSLLAEGQPMGAINFYADAIGSFADRDEIDFAVLYGTHVAIALATNRESVGLQTALHSRHTIGLAQGILMERFDLNVDQSFDVLRRYSSTTNTKLSVVADEIVRTGTLPGAPPHEIDTADHPGHGSAVPPLPSDPRH